MKLLYLLINCFTAIVPVIFSFHPKLKFYKNFRSFFGAAILSAAIFIVWDINFTKQGVWGFNENYITGTYLFTLPIEEILFFFCIPYACVFTYHCLNLFFNIYWTSKTEHYFVLTASFILLSAGIYFHTQLYTASTFISLSILLLTLKYLVRIPWLAKLVTIYPVLLIPFILVNGILTGTGLEKPVVWYNNEENSGIRLLTIPLEDFFYGFELILLDIFFYEYFRNKFSER